MSPALNLINSYRKKIPYLLAVFFLTFVLAAQAAILCPPRVMAAESTAGHQLDKPFVIAVWGLVDKKSLSLEIEPNLPVKTTWKSSFFPLVQRLVIEPVGLVPADSNYSIKVAVKNWSGTTSVSELLVQTESLPKVLSANPALNEENVLPDSEIVFALDKTFTAESYELLAEPKFDYDLQVRDSKVFVKPSKRLIQGQKYDLQLLLKLANGETEPIYTISFTVVTPLNIAASNPTNNAETVLKQTKISLTFNKAVDKQIWTKSFRIEPETAGDFSWLDEKTVVFTPSAPLKTNTSYSIKISAAALRGIDGSRLEQDLGVNFKTAGPVRVLAFSPTGSAANPNSKIKVTFDQPVDQPSAQERFSLSPTVPGSFSWEGNTLVFHPSGLSLSATYQVSMAAAIKSVGGEDSTIGFSTTFTTTSERARVIGYSVRGRPVTATYFGLGPQKILLIGALHGSETNTGVLLSQWIDFLRANQTSIASDRTFIIVPYANPDGKAAATRFNANRVDLNRNWGSSSWQSTSYWMNNAYPNGGGAQPFSEPETQALRNLLLSERPSRVISYHAAINAVIGGSIADSFADWYSSQTGYPKASGGEETFGYPITGTLEEWANDNGMMTIVVELASATSSEYGRNLPALKGLLNLPI